MPDPPNDPIQQAVETVERNRESQIAGERQGAVALFVCPECGGALWQMDEPELVYFRCHVGHTITGEALLLQQADAAENALWRTVRTLNDSMVLASQLTKEAEKQGNAEAAVRFEQWARTAQKQADALQRLAEGGLPESEPGSGANRTAI